MAEGAIHITSRPPGGAPEWVRDAWRELILPIDHTYNGPAADVRTYEFAGMVNGYSVFW